MSQPQTKTHGQLVALKIIERHLTDGIAVTADGRTWAAVGGGWVHLIGWYMGKSPEQLAQIKQAAQEVK